MLAPQYRGDRGLHVAPQPDHTPRPKDPACAPGTLSAPDALGMLAHDVRGSLHVINTYATAFRDKPHLLTGPAAQTGMGAIARHSGIVLDLLQDFLTVMQSEDQLFTLELDKVDLRTVVERAVGLVSDRFPEHAIGTRVDAAPLTTIVDPVRIEHVIVNLLSNAAKNTNPGDGIRIEATPLGSEVLVTVRDAGPGIPDEVRPELFTKFPRIARKTGGVGLGLYVCKIVVEAHGGRIWATSRPSGATFSFLLPLIPA